MHQTSGIKFKQLNIHPVIYPLITVLSDKCINLELSLKLKSLENLTNSYHTVS